ncbi:MAG: pseudouridine synthase [Elusimicrobia bacterium]|nr:pseudouridine synthase [Elusimicrobiota bacterium]
MKRVILFYKPYGVLSQFTAHDGHPGLSGFGLPAGVYAAGRLDRDSEGLLLLTDDGRLQRRLTDPRFGHPRTYWAQVEGTVTPQALQLLARGVRLSDGPTRPCRARLMERAPQLPAREPPIRFRKSVSTAWIELVLTEGRNRQVRRMTAAVGLPTLRLVRSGIGRFSLAALAPGTWRQVAARDSSGL